MIGRYISAFSRVGGLVWFSTDFWWVCCMFV